MVYCSQTKPLLSCVNHSPHSVKSPGSYPENLAIQPVAIKGSSVPTFRVIPPVRGARSQRAPNSRERPLDPLPPPFLGTCPKPLAFARRRPALAADRFSEYRILARAHSHAVDKRHVSAHHLVVLLAPLLLLLIGWRCARWVDIIQRNSLLPQKFRFQPNLRPPHT
jgi:hypothetical protein